MQIKDLNLLEEFASGSKQAIMAKCEYRGKKYQVKVHGSEPKWFKVEDAIKAKKQELNRAGDDEKDRIQSELDSLKANRDKRNADDAISDQYLELRKDVIKTVKSIGDPLLVPPDEAWTEPIESKGNAVYMVEITPWVETSVWFEDDKPISFSKDLTQDEQYDIIASLADKVAELHAAGVMHNDLKIDNTVISKGADGKRSVALIDYDAALVLRDLQRKKYPAKVWRYEVGGTYFAPEYKLLFEMLQDDIGSFDTFDLNTITTKADIFSLAFTIYEYFYGVLGPDNPMPFKDDEGNTLNGIARNDYQLAIADFGYRPAFPEDPDVMSDLLYGVLRWMLDMDPSKRPTAEQVRDVFKNRDLKLIPGEYCRLDLFSPWEEDNIEFIPVSDRIVQKSPHRKGSYMVTRKRPDGSTGLVVTRDAAGLIREGLAKSTAAPEPVKVEDRTFWPSDGMSGDMPECVSRKEGADGKYILTVYGGLSTVCTLAELKQKGVVCSSAELITPWPDDNIHFITGKRVERDMKRGPKHYLVKMVPSQRLTSDEMVSKNYASKSITFSLQKSDVDAYVVNAEASMPDVKSIIRSVTGKGYMVSYLNGTSMKLSIDEMLAKGYVKRK